MIPLAKRNVWETVALVLVVIGGLNWGLVGLANLNVVSTLLGNGLIARALYALVGLSALYMIYYISRK